MEKSSTENLKKRAVLAKAIMIVSAGFILLTIGYTIAMLIRQNVHSLSEFVGRNVFSLGGFGASLILSAYVLKKTKAEISLRESQATNH